MPGDLRAGLECAGSRAGPGAGLLGGAVAPAVAGRTPPRSPPGLQRRACLQAGQAVHEVPRRSRR
ncbi:hypothetical protein HBB16_17245 [Pseudonocardia sp. MCCB 268]|nr:hypothetical protein [Pseudonocardia cytotoxica]